jgi:P2-related tail formation protein
MSTFLRSSRLIENCTPSISYDAQVQSASESFDHQMWEIIDDTGVVIMIPNIMGLTDENLVDILAWQFHVDFYDPTRDLEFKKQLVQLSIIWHKTKGTVRLVEDVINTYFPGSNAHLQEWFQYYNPLPPNYGDPVLAGTFTAAQINPGSNTFTYSGAVNDTEVAFTNVAGTLPTPIEAGVIYYIVNATATTFQISIEPGGTPLDIKNQGSGTNSIYTRNNTWHNRYRFRILVNEDVIATPEQEAQMLELIERFKPVSRWLEAIVHPKHSFAFVYVTGFAQIFVTRRSNPAIIRTP